MPGETVGPAAVSPGTHPGGLDGGEELTGVSLFAGIEGFGLAMERAGIDVRVAVEIDPACRSVIARHFPNVALFPDVTKVTAREILAAGFVPYRGIITAGFPCQDLSISGRRAGLAGARSGLFWHIMRLADELHPRWILLENVPGLLSAVCPCPGGGACVANRRAVQCGDWRVAAPGRGVRHLRRIRSKFYEWHPDVPHGTPGGACPGGCMPAHGGAMGTVLGALGQRGYGIAYRVLDSQFFGVPQRRDRVFIAGCLGDRAAPSQVLLEPESSGGHPAPRREAGTCIAGPLDSRVGGARTTDIDGHGAYIPGTIGTIGAGGPGGGWRVGADEAAAGQLVTVATLQGGGRRGHRIDAEGAAGGHLVAIPDGPLAFDAAQITHPENRVNPKPGDPAPPLAATGQPMVAGATTVRRLTPLEYERLQGFPDDWTRWLADGTEQSDSARYRECGNAVPVPVAEWITRRIVTVWRAAQNSRGAAA